MNYYSNTCECGCGGQIEIKEYHKYKGIPLYISGHQRRNKIPWNKGLTKDNCDLIIDMAKKSSETQKNNPPKGMLGKKHSEKTKQLMRENNYNKGKHLPEMTKEKMINSIKRGFNLGRIVWNDSRICDSDKIKDWIKKIKIKPNKAELSLQDIIKSITNSFTFVGDGKEIIGNKCPDFIDKANNKIIELYGDYWHKGQDPNVRINYFKNYGYNTLVIWESELKNKETLKIKLIDFSINKQEVH